MIVRTTTEITDTDRDITSEDGNWRSKRIVLGGDRVGFSFHETTIKAGSVNEFHYANHVEAVWLVEGTRQADRPRQRQGIRSRTGVDVPAQRPRAPSRRARHADAHAVRVQSAGHRA